MMRTQRKAGCNSVILVIIIFLCSLSLFQIYRSHRSSHVVEGLERPQSHTTSLETADSPLEDGAVDDAHRDTSSNKTQVDLVVASTKNENTTWIHERVRDWRAQIYAVDDPEAPLTVGLNKGKESMVYLTYIIDRYFHLPDVVIFLHAERFQWHNDDPDYDGLTTLRNLQLPYVQEKGYVNLRCVWVLGCPVEIRPIYDAANPDDVHRTAMAYKTAFEELLPGTEVPKEVGQACCAQFAVTRQAIMSRSRAEYEHFRQWLVDTTLDDDTAGRVFEYLWHIVFGKEAVFCPDAGQCYCRLFGLCDLKCEQGHCEDRYVLPKYSQLPQNWPYVDWDGSPRSFKEPAW